MITLRLAVPAVLAAAVLAGCFTYLVTPPSAQIDAGQPLPPTVLKSKGYDATTSTSVDLLPTADEKAAAAYWGAAQAILRRAPNAQASADAEEPPIKRPIPLPRRRPVMAP
jgi:hypothetical protein